MPEPRRYACVPARLCFDLPWHTLNSKRSEREVPNVQNCFRRAELELRGPRNGARVAEGWKGPARRYFLDRAAAYIIVAPE
eukprot:1734925-Alexandrium_andersonii.AAC.1